MSQFASESGPGTYPAAPAPEPAVVSEEGYRAYLDALSSHPDLQGENVSLSESLAARLSLPLMIVGVAGLGLTAVGGLVGGAQHAMAAFQAAAWSVLGPCLGCLFLVMVFQILNTRWSVTIRRQAENIASAIWLPVLLVIAFVLIELLAGGIMLEWLGIAPGEDYLLDKKAAYLNPWFLVARLAICVVAWLGLAAYFSSTSRQQDQTGDRWLTRRMRQTSGWGLLVFTATAAFASYDLLMTVDHHFFSTMWPVYIFAGSILAAVSLLAVVLGLLHMMGKLNNLVTKEHFHDLGKLMFAFNCFWAYVAFSQYFLIWYGNIPEETSFFLHRKTGGWEVMTWVLCIGHFVIPLLVLVSRVPKKSIPFMVVAGLYMLVMGVLDLLYITRPMVTWSGQPPTPADWWIDAVAVIGAWALFAGVLVRAIAKAPLVPLLDPRLGKCMEHRNWV